MAFFLLTLLSVTCFGAYLSFIVAIGGVLSSLSDSYYLLEERKKNLGVLFYFCLAATVFTCVAPMCEVAGAFGFLAGFALLLVGVAPRFKEKKSIERILHIIGAITSASAAIMILIRAGQVSVIIPVTLLVIILSAITNTFKSCVVWWAEMVAFYSLFAGLLLHYWPY